MDITEYINVLCPQLLTVSGYTAFIDIAKETLSPEYFGEKYNYAVALKAAHLYILNTKRNGDSGVITGKTEGRLSVSYSHAIKGNYSELEMTSYGKELLQLIYNMGQCGIIGSTDIYNTM